MISSQSERQEYRKQICAYRRTLSLETQQQAAKKLYTLVCKQDFFKQAQAIAFYMPHQGEISPALLIHRSHIDKKHTYLPVLNPTQHNTLLFLPFTQQTTLVKNKYHIDEPPFNDTQVFFPWHLDVVFMPLVAFDQKGHRLGMGAGYYDRTFSFIQQTHLKRPVLCGLSYEFQKVDDVLPMPWDIPLDCIITEAHFYRI